MARSNSAAPAAEPSAEARARIAREQAQRKAFLWQQYMLSDEESAEAVGIPLSSWHFLKTKPKAPPSFPIGRRRFCLVSDLMAWARERASTRGGADDE